MRLAPEVLEPVTARAWRAVEEAALGGWRLNASAGFSGRINACWPLGEPGLETDAAIVAVEDWYGSRGLPPRFKLAADLARPFDLPARLTARGCAPGEATLVMTGPVGGDRDRRVSLAGRPGPAFVDIFLATSSVTADARERLGALERTPPPRAFALALEAGAPAAIGACAVERPFVGIFAMRTAPGFRRRGLARAVLDALTAFGRESGASVAWLQVENGNLGARELYASSGFVERYRCAYWSRTLPQAPVRS